MFPPPPRRIEALIRSLGTAHGRKKSGLAVLEGVRAAESLQASGAPVKAVIALAGALRDERTGRVVSGFAARGAPVFEAAATLMKALTQVEAPQGVFVICEPPRVTLEDALRHAFVLAADAVQDPGNLGTMLRLAAAFGVGAVVTTKGTVEVANPKTVRAAAGAWPGLPVADGVEPGVLVRALKSAGHRIVVADARGTADTESVGWAGKIALVAGSEGHGAGTALAAAAAVRVRIPLAPDVESLNVASACAILLAQSARRRGFPAH